MFRGTVLFIPVIQPALVWESVPDGFERLLLGIEGSFEIRTPPPRRTCVWLPMVLKERCLRSASCEHSSD